MTSPVRQFMANRSLACLFGYVATLRQSCVKKALSLDLVWSNFCSIRMCFLSLLPLSLSGIARARATAICITLVRSIHSMFMVVFELASSLVSATIWWVVFANSLVSVATWGAWSGIVVNISKRSATACVVGGSTVSRILDAFMIYQVVRNCWA